MTIFVNGYTENTDKINNNNNDTTNYKLFFPRIKSFMNSYIYIFHQISYIIIQLQNNSVTYSFLL